MRALAKAPMPTWRAVDLDGGGAVGRRRRDRAGAARQHVGVLEELEQPGRELQLLGDAGDGEAVADGEVAERDRGRAAW